MAGAWLFAQIVLAFSEPSPHRGSPSGEFFAPGSLHQVRLNIATGDLDALRKVPRGYVPATVTLDGEVCRNVAVHLKGATGSFRPVDDKPGLTLSFDRFRPGTRFRGLRKLHLNNSVEDPAYVNEFIGAELFRAAGVPAPRVSLAWVELNGRVLGAYVLKEGFAEEFLAGYFRRTDGNFYDTDLGHDINQRMRRSGGRGEAQEQSDLEKLTLAAEERDLALRWDRLEHTLDLDRFVNFLVMEVMIGHRDGYSLARNNFRIYHDMDSGRLMFFPHGMDQLFGKADLPWEPHFAGLVARAVMETPNGRRQYRDRFLKLFNQLYQVERLTNLVARTQEPWRNILPRQERLAMEREGALVMDRIVQRKANLKWQLGQPELKPLEFVEGVARLAGWVAVDEPGGGRMDQVQDVDGKSVLRIQAGPSTTASWRSKVRLARGHYRFEALARTHGVKPLPFGKAQGASMRVSGRERTEAGRTGDSPWLPLVFEFQVEAVTEESELVCELRGSAGEVCWDKATLRLLRLP